MYDLFDDFPDTDAAYLEVANHCHDLAHWKPSHEVVYEAGRRVGFSKLRRRDTGAGKRAFATMYKNVCKAWQRGERFKREPIKPPSFGERIDPRERFARRQLGREKVNELRAMLRG